MPNILSSEMFSRFATPLPHQTAPVPELTKRPRRNRKSSAVRSLVQETHLHPSNFVSPLFVLEGNDRKEAVQSMPGVFKLSIDLLLKEIEELLSLGICAIDLFAVIAKEHKDPWGSHAIHDNNLLIRAVSSVKQRFPELCVMADVALDPFTDHGHDGLINDKGEVINDATLKVLGQMSILLAEAGADVIAPSDMMDGRVGYIRTALDRSGHSEVSILSYAAKYASAFYGPFREALDSSPSFGDKKGYQLNPANSREALLEALLDEQEGADILLIKPALAYLDIINKIKEATHLPIAAYHVSGEYAMVKAADQLGWINGERVMHESLLSIKRAGADFILSYAAKEMALLLRRCGQ